MEWQVSEEKFKTYSALLKAASEIESNMGSMMYRISKLNTSREDVDREFMILWDAILKENELDPKQGYYISNDGKIKLSNPPIADGIPTPAGKV